MPQAATPPSKDFADTLDELIAFKEYFTDDDESKKLAKIIHEETSIPMLACQLAVRYIAPFVVARIAKASGHFGQKWMVQLHDKLGDTISTKC